MTLHEITPKQLRALLLLLVLVPFIPMVLMLRFMLDALEGERDAALERAGSVYQQTLADAGGLVVAGPASPRGRLVAQAQLRHLDLPWQARLYLVDDSAIKQAVRAQ